MFRAKEWVWPLRAYDPTGGFHRLELKRRFFVTWIIWVWLKCGLRRLWSLLPPKGPFWRFHVVSHSHMAVELLKLSLSMLGGCWPAPLGPARSSDSRQDKAVEDFCGAGEGGGFGSQRKVPGWCLAEMPSGFSGHGQAVEEFEQEFEQEKLYHGHTRCNRSTEMYQILNLRSRNRFNRQMAVGQNQWTILG